MTVEQLLKQYFEITGTVTVRANDIVDVDGNVKLKENTLVSQLPVQFGAVTGSFNCGYNDLTTLQNAPKIVEDYFNCSDNRLTSLQGAPHTVRGSFDCSNNLLTSLQGAPKIVENYFTCSDNLLTSLQGAPQTVEGFYCDHNKLTSLEGAPQTVRGNFNCDHNKLTSLQGIPQKMTEFIFTYNENIGLLKLIVNDIQSIDIYDKYNQTVSNIINRYREEANSVSTTEQRNAVAVKCAAELIRAGYRNNARL